MLEALRRKPALRHALIILTGFAVYYLLGAFAQISTGIPLVYIYLQYPVLCVLAGMYGPVVGGLIGLLGHIAIDLTHEGFIWWSWVICSGLLGVLVGWLSRLLHLRLQLRLPPEDSADRATAERHARRRAFMLAILLSNMVIWMLVAPLLDILLYHTGTTSAFVRGLFAALSNGLTTAVVADLLTSPARRTAVLRAVGFVLLLNSLVMISWGNRSTGARMLYGFTVVVCLMLFFYQTILYGRTKEASRRRTALRMVIGGCGMLYVLLLLFIGAAGYASWPTGNERVMIVLGAGLEGEEPNALLRCRLDAAREWADAHPDVIIITSGGQGADEILPEGEAMRNYLIRQGVSPDRIHAEDASTDTDENFAFSRQLMESLGYSAQEPVIYVSNFYHCFRAGLYASRAGFAEPKGLAASMPITGVLPNMLRESLALIKFGLVSLRDAR